MMLHPLEMLAAFWAVGDYTAVVGVACGLLVLPVWAIAAIIGRKK